MGSKYIGFIGLTALVIVVYNNIIQFANDITSRNDYTSLVLVIIGVFIYYAMNPKLLSKV